MFDWDILHVTITKDTIVNHQHYSQWLWIRTTSKYWNQRAEWKFDDSIRYNERVRKLADRFHEGIIASPLTARIDDSLRVVLSSRLVSTEVPPASVSLHKPSWIAFPLPGVTPLAANDESSRVQASDDNEDGKATRDSGGRAFSSVTNRDIHSLVYAPPRIFSSPFSLYALFCPHFSISFDTWRARNENTIYLNC